MKITQNQSATERANLIDIKTCIATETQSQQYGVQFECSDL